MSEEQRFLADTVRQLLLDATTTGRGGQSPQTRLQAAGMSAVSIPEELGGEGGSLLDAATIAFEMGRSGVSAPAADGMLVAGWLDGLAGWRWSGGPETVAVDFASAISITRTPTGARLSGTLRHVPWAREAQRIIVVSPSSNGATLLRLTPEDCRTLPATNLAGEARDHVVLDQVEVPRSDVWDGDGALNPLEALQRGALVRTVMMAGAAVAILHLATDYSLEREQFGRPIARFQAVQQLLARLAGEVLCAVTSARSAVDAAQSGRADVEVMAAKIRVGIAANRITRIAHQVHGAIGVTLEYPLERFTTRLWSWRSEYGSSSFWAARLGEKVGERSGAGDQIWALITGTDRSATDA